jgi:signal transduction histidine kinase
VFGRFKLRSKVTALLLALAVGPLVVNGLVSENRAIDSGKRAARQHYAAAARHVAESTDRLFEQVRTDVAVLARRFPVEQIRFDNLRAFLDAGGGPLADLDAWDDAVAFTELHPKYTTTFFALADGRVVFSVPYRNLSTPVTLPVGDDGWLQRAVRVRRPVFADLSGLTASSRPSLVSVFPIRDRSRSVVGYVGAIVDQSELSLLVRSALPRDPSSERASRAAVTLLAPDARIASSSSGDGIGQRAPGYLRSLMSPGTVEVEVDDEDLLIARAAVGHTGWYVALSTPTRDAYRDIFLLIWLLTVVIVLTTLFVLLFADHIASLITRPIAELERGAKMIGAGALDYRIDLPAHARDELGDLAGSFNIMGESLVRSRRDLDAYSRNLEMANQELDAMVYAITHDLRKSLRGIEGFATFLGEDYEDALDDEGRELLEGIIHNAHHINHLADNLLALVDHDRERHERTTFPMSEVLEEAAAHAREIYDGEVVIESDLPELTAERSSVLLVFDNLISNGLKFNRSPKPRVRVRCEDDGMYWRFEIEDNGIGIDPRYREQVFELFSRLNTKDAFDGTGTGLNLARRIVEEQRGTIRVGSPERGAGTVIEVTLPKDASRLTSPGFTL